MEPIAGDVVLISTYELGRQPFGLASPAAWLRAAGARVDVQDLAVCGLDAGPVAAADLVCIYVPMHTATRLAGTVVERVRSINDRAHLCCYGLYAPMNEDWLRGLGVDSVLGGEFEQGLVDLYREVVGGERPARRPAVSLARQRFAVPDRSGLPTLDRYARLRMPDGTERMTGYTEASRGCKHRCRHCPVVPVYDGTFRIVAPDVVLADVRAQVAAGARHITFGDPDFFNGPAHAMRVVSALHDEFPGVTYDVTIKVEHLLVQAHLLGDLASTGCVLVTSAVESFDDRVLEILDKGHTRADVAKAVRLLAEHDLAFNPTFVAFTPWTTPDGYVAFLAAIADLGLVEHVSPVQYAIRLLLPAGSKLLEVPEVAALAGGFDPAALVHPWRHPDPAMDRLHADVTAAVQDAVAAGRSRRDVFAGVWAPAAATTGRAGAPPVLDDVPGVATVPYLTEPWYC